MALQYTGRCALPHAVTPPTYTQPYGLWLWPYPLWLGLKPYAYG